MPPLTVVRSLKYVGSVAGLVVKVVPLVSVVLVVPVLMEVVLVVAVPVGDLLVVAEVDDAVACEDPPDEPPQAATTNTTTAAKMTRTPLRLIRAIANLLQSPRAMAQ